MYKITFIFFAFFAFSNSIFSQDSLRNNLEINMQVVPLVSNVFDNFRKSSIFAIPKLKQVDNSSIMKYYKVLTKQTYTLRYNRINKKRTLEYGLGINYCKVRIFGLKLSNFYLVKPFYGRSIGGEINILGRFEDTDNNKNTFAFLSGLRIGGSYIFQTPKEIKVAKFKKELSINDNNPFYYKKINEVDSIQNFDFNLKPNVKNLYLKWSFIGDIRLNSKFSLNLGLDIPILRFFFYNHYKFLSGVFLFSTSFFTPIFKSYNFDLVHDEYLNENLAFSLKKSQATNINIGIKYHF